MRNARNVIIALFLLFCGLAPSAWALHPFYEQNGDCYVLICNGPLRGAYALNNLTTGVVEKIWNLKWGKPAIDLEAFGIAAHQTWDGSSSQKRIYIFAGKDSDYLPFTGLVPRRCIVWPTANASAPDSTDFMPTTIVHRYHNQPGDSPTGRGNHTTTDYMRSLTDIFDGTCYPCSVIPASTTGKSGYYDIPAGQWYHSLDAPVRSPYAYGREGCRRGPWWVHYVVRENLLVKNRDIKLHMVNRNASTTNGGSYPSAVANVILGQTGTMDERGECVDGCIRAVDDIKLPGSEVPYLDVAYSSINNSYLYRRDPSAATYLLVGKDANTTLVGDGSDLTTVAMGVSSKSSLGDYVYLVGTGVINSWFAAAGSPGSIASCTDFAVSDQWWQTGGITYAYDRTMGEVFKFVRNETPLALPAEPVPIPVASMVSDGILPDAISTDGFGHLYLMKTQKEPDDPANFAPVDACNVTYTFTDGLGKKYYRADFHQGVYKTAYKRDYYTQVTAPISGRIPLGTNKFIRDFTVAPTRDVSDLTSWVWTGPATLEGVEVASAYRVEIAVINSATPPQVSGDRRGLADLRGPLVYVSPTFEPAVPEGDGKFVDSNVYFFEVENYPAFDTNGVNTVVNRPDIDGDGRSGSYPSTVKKDSLVYYWKVIQLEDSSGLVVNNTILDQAATGHSGSKRYSAALSAGKYSIGFKCIFQYYDYDLLLPGSLAQDKETVLQPSQTAVGEDAQGYSWVTFTIKGVPPNLVPGGNGVIMSGKPNFRPPGFTFKPLATDPSTDPAGIPIYVIPELNPGTWSFKLRDSAANVNGGETTDRLRIMASTTPPIPAGISRMVPGSNVWTGDQAFQWTANLNKDGDTLVNVIRDTGSRTELSQGEAQELFPVPSQPATYSLIVRGSRQGNLRAYFPTRIEHPDGTFGTDWGEPQDVPIIVQIAAQCDVIEKDNTGPARVFPDPLVAGGFVTGVFVNKTVLYGTTGESLVDVELPPSPIPSSLVYVVADNNPNGNVDNTHPLVDYVDPYHGEAVSHNYNGRYGQIVYPTVPPPTGPDPRAEWYRTNPLQNNSGTTYRFFQKDLTLADFGVGDLSWLGPANCNRAFSYRMFKLDISDMVHLSASGTNGNLLPMGIANNTSTYANIPVGIVSKDASPAPANSKTNLLATGVIVVRDNDRPNAFLEVWDLKKEGVKYFVPSNLKSEFIPGWTRLANTATLDAIHNGVEDWMGDDILGFDVGIKGTAGPVTTLLTSPTTEFEVDVPIFFKPILGDNLGSPTIEIFKLFDPYGAELVSHPGGEPIQYLFRKPSNPGGMPPSHYRVQLKVRDDARGWPTVALDPYNTAPVQVNERNLDSSFDVYDVRLDVRIIDRTKNNR